MTGGVLAAAGSMRESGWRRIFWGVNMSMPPAPELSVGGLPISHPPKNAARVNASGRKHRARGGMLFMPPC